jgi:hypothetical protein
MPTNRKEVGDSKTVLQATVGGLAGWAENVKHTKGNSNARRTDTGRASMCHDNAQPRALTYKSKAASTKNTEYTENVKSPVA